MMLTLLLYVALGFALSGPLWLVWTRWLWPRLWRGNTRLQYLVAYQPVNQRSTTAPPAKE